MPETQFSAVLSKRVRKAIRWLALVLLVQFVLINISAVFYASRLTCLKDNVPENVSSSTNNFFRKTIKLFTGPHLYKFPVREQPVFVFDTIRLQTKAGHSIHAWYGRQDTAAKGTVLLFHGVTSNKAAILTEANEFRYWGYNVLLVDFRAHGLSSGNVTTYGIKESEEVKLAYDYIQDNGEKNIILWGISMGAVAAAKAVADYSLQPKAIILEAPFASLEHHFKGRARTLGFPGQPFAWLVTRWAGIIRGVKASQHQTTRFAQKIQCPVLLQYGVRDTYVKQTEVEAIYREILSVKKKLVIYQESGHESMAQRETAKWRKEVFSFLHDAGN